MTRVKFCGLRRREDALSANRLMPDFAGVVLSPGFKRSVSEEVACELRQILDLRIKLVGVFVNERPERVIELLQNGLIDAAQLHGDEPPEDIERIRKASGKPVIKFFALRDGGDAAMAQASPADFVLLDSGTGTGKAFDWTLTQLVRRPFFLAGGLTAGNVGDAIHTCRPYAVDVSSGIETEGKKDFEKMAAFLAAVSKEEAI